jgi:hypothetical protein
VKKRPGNMSISMSDAWAEEEEGDFHSFDSSRKKERHASREEEEEEDQEYGRKFVSGKAARASGKKSSSPPVSPYEEMILAELRMLRLEESRRCTAYIAVGGALFALLFMYVDRLQKQVRRLGDITLRTALDQSRLASQTQSF